MSIVSNFTQPDASPAYFVGFLDLLDGLPGLRGMRAQTLERMSLQPGYRVLDLGCGIGGMTFPLADLTGPTGHVAGVDVSAALIDAATRRAGDREGLEFRIGDASAIPYPDRFFDAAYCERVFLYLPDRLAVIQEMKRVVKPGGRIWLIDTDFDSMAIYSTHHALTRKITSLVAASIPNPNSARELPTLVRQAGLQDLQTETFALTTPHEFMLYVVKGTLTQSVAKGDISPVELGEWLGEQASLHARGEFFQAWLFVRSSGMVAA